MAVDFCLLLKEMVKNVDNNINQTLSGKYNQKLLHHAKNLQQIHLKFLQRGQFKKQQKQLVI